MTITIFDGAAAASAAFDAAAAIRAANVRSEKVICTQMAIGVGEPASSYLDHGPTFRAHQRMAIINGAALEAKGCDYDYEPPEPESLQEPTSLRWTMRPIAQPVRYVTDKQTGYAFGLSPAPVRSDRNHRKELNSRSKLREVARHDPAAFRAALPDGILSRILIADADDVPNGAPMRHPTLAPTWFDSYGDGKFMVVPRHKQNVSPGLALGAAEIAAEGDIPTVNVHGVMIGLRRADKPAKVRRETLASLPKPTRAGRRYEQRELMAFAASRGTIPSFLAGITIAAARSPV